MTNSEYNNIVLVPTDFTAEAACAMDHAAVFAKKSAYSILLVHVLDSKSKEKMKSGETSEAKYRSDLAGACAELKTKGVSADYLLEPGDIFTTISEVATREKVNLIVMGTHGVKGMQHVLGAFAMKVITSAPVPTIIVQNKNATSSGYKTIVYPVDDSRENKHKLIHAIHLAPIFGSTVHLLPTTAKEDYLKKDIQLNLNYTKNNLEKRGINCVLVDTKDGDANSQENIMAYSKKASADLVIIRSYKEKKMKEFFVGPDSIKLINNEQETPVMCINPIEDLFLAKSAVMLGSK